MKDMKPMEPILQQEIVQSNEYIHQIKWDGIRIMSFIDGNNLELYTKRGTGRTNQYPEIRELLKLDHVSSAVYDGEVVCMKNGKPSFREIIIRNRTTKEIAIKELIQKYPVYYVMFDILMCNGVDLRNKPFHERHKILNTIITPSDRMKLAENHKDGNQLYERVKENALEGIVSKKLSSSYIAGKKHNGWYKYKLSRRILCVVCGIHLNSDKKPKSILLGIHSEEKLTLVGSAASGLSMRDIQLLNDFKDNLKTPYNPFNQKESSDNHIIWIHPILTCWISFMEWTEDGMMRHPKIIGFSDQKIEEADGTEYVK